MSFYAYPLINTWVLEEPVKLSTKEMALERSAFTLSSPIKVSCSLHGNPSKRKNTILPPALSLTLFCHSLRNSVNPPSGETVAAEKFHRVKGTRFM
jgi:hypothetical protein